MSDESTRTPARRSLLSRLFSVALVTPFLGKAQVLETAEDLVKRPPETQPPSRPRIAIQAPTHSVPRRG